MEDTLRQQVEKRSYELFLARGGDHGYHLEDWLQAEKEILGRQETVVAKKVRKKAAPQKAPAKKAAKKKA